MSAFKFLGTPVDTRVFERGLCALWTANMFLNRMVDMPHRLPPLRLKAVHKRLAMCVHREVGEPFTATFQRRHAPPPPPFPEDCRASGWI